VRGTTHVLRHVFRGPVILRPLNGHRKGKSR
jgi:hypothetical protein